MSTISPVFSSPEFQNSLGISARRQESYSPSVVNRLQGFFSSHLQSPKNNCNVPRPGDSERLDKTSPTVNDRFVKIRILTWNMHDCLPKGDLEQLLGKVPHYESSASNLSNFPELLNDSKHPYHLVVIAGQECPTPSGIPMGLGAGFKILDKDRDKSKESDLGHGELHSKSKDKIEDSRSQRLDEELEKVSSGWTSMIEDFLCNDGGLYNQTKLLSTNDIGFPQPLVRQKSSKEHHRRGPYQLLIKDRLMGIYLAIYVHRDLKHLVQGLSKSVVTAGLIGGRVGNKGGVGISLNIDGTTFLFVNAHLAAHEGKVNHRLSNLNKIKVELSVDDFLLEDDPRLIAEDITDRFDFTFLFGDLNFRLDISRQHADWLISHQNYTQALEFDQLNALMKQSSFFSGFREAPINFPPTFKYDVLRTLKHSRRYGIKSLKGRPLTIPEPDGRDASDAEEIEEDLEGASIASSAQASMTSRLTSEMDESNCNTSHLAMEYSATSKASTVARKAKKKWLSLLSPLIVTHSRTGPKDDVGSALAGAAATYVMANGKKRFQRPPPIILVDDIGKDGVEDNVVEDKGVYDSSHKKRVPSWCDRILWKTTIIPDPDATASYNGQHSSHSRVGQLLLKKFRPTRSAVDASLNAGLASVKATPRSDSRTVEKLSSAATFYNSPHPATALGHFGIQRAKTTFSSPRTAPLISGFSPRRSTASAELEDFPSGRSQISKATPNALWRFLPAFLSPNNPQGPAIDSPRPSSPIRPLKGDVICLTYDTLDDHGMRLLEARSDHRPVIGSYAVYI